MIRHYVRNALIAAGLLAFSIPTASAQFYRPEKPDAFMRDNAKIKSIVKPVLAEVAKSVVKILADGKEVCLGTVVDSDGWIITKVSELRSEKLKVKFKDGREFEPKIIGVDDRNDVALLKINASNLPVVDWRDSKTAKLGNFVLTPGTDGDVIAIGVVGVLTKQMKMSDYPVANRSRNSGWLGVSLEPTKNGVQIKTLVKDGAASKAGLKTEDVVLSVEGRKVADSETMIFYLLRYRVGEEVSLKVRRGEEELDITATLGKRPSEFQAMGLDRGQFQNGIHKELSDVNIGFPVALQHDSVLKAREVGGPLVDLDGKVIGINIASAGRVDSYAIPSEVIQSLLVELKSGKLAPVKIVKRTEAKKPEEKKIEDKKPEEKKPTVTPQGTSNK